MSTTPLAYPPTIPNLMARAAASFGRRDYVVTLEQRLSFAAAEEQSRHLAARLLRAGIGKGTRVGLLFPQGPDFVVALLAVTRIGALAVLLSTFARGPELRRAVRHADLDTLLAARSIAGHDTEQLLAAAWEELGEAADQDLCLTEAPYLRRIWLVGDATAPWATPVPALDQLTSQATDDALVRQVETEVTPSDLMVMIHTSGATADPKAVVHTHGAQVRQAWTLAQLYGFTEDVRTFTNMPFFWVGGLTVSLLTHMHAGGAVLTIDRMDGPAMVDLIERERATRLSGWTLLDRLSADPALAGRDLSGLAALDAAGGDPTRRHNSLGMSETCGPHTATSAQENAQPLPEHLRGSFGPAVPGFEHRIVDLETRSTDEPEGVEGEILVRGPSLLAGLYKKERAETFDRDGWYHTGDKGFFRGRYLFYTGRLTEMIKTGGANVAPREVELAVESLPGVKAAFVIGLPDEERGQLVACLVCPEPGADLDAQSLAGELRQELSSYKVPRRIKVVPYDDAPWLPSGKISRPRLAQLLADDPG